MAYASIGIGQIAFIYEMIDIINKFNEMDGTVIQVSRGVMIRLTAMK